MAAKILLVTEGHSAETAARLVARCPEAEMVIAVRLARRREAEAAVVLAVGLPGTEAVAGLVADHLATAAVAGLVAGHYGMEAVAVLGAGRRGVETLVALAVAGSHGTDFPGPDPAFAVAGSLELAAVCLAYSS